MEINFNGRVIMQMWRRLVTHGYGPPFHPHSHLVIASTCGRLIFPLP